MKALLQSLAALIILCIALISCHHEPNIPQPDCHVDSVTYTNYIKFIVADKCLGCHTANSIDPTLDTYDQVVAVVNDGRFLKVITAAPGYPSMPYQSEPLPDCVIGNIKQWIDAGTPE